MATTHPGTWIQTWATPSSLYVAAGLRLDEAMREALTFCLEPEEAERRLQIFGESLVKASLADAVAASFEGTPQGVQLLGQTMFWTRLDTSLGIPGTNTPKA